MRKLNLNVANLGATEILSREELKKVLGGTGTGSDDYVDCTKLSSCDTSKKCQDPNTREGKCGIFEKTPALGCRCIITEAP